MSFYHIPIRGGRPTKPKRALTKTTNGTLEKPDTVCARMYTNQPRRHMLVCGHDIRTETPVACTSYCQLIENARSMPMAKGFVCMKAACGRVERQKRETSVFIPDQKKTVASGRSSVGAENRPPNHDGKLSMPRSKTPAGISSQRQVLIPKSNRAPRGTSRGPTRQLADQDEELRALNREIATDKGLQVLLASRAEGGTRMKSKLHLGYALKDERVTERNFANLHKSLGKFEGLGQSKIPGGFRGQNLAADPTFGIPDVPYGEQGRATVEHSLNKKAKRKASTYSLRSPPSKHQKVNVRHASPLTSDDDVNEIQAPRAVEDFGDGENFGDEGFERDELVEQDQGVRADGSYFQAELHCVCNSPADEDMQQCVDCEGHFHPACFSMHPDSFERCRECEAARILEKKRTPLKSSGNNDMLSQIRVHQKMALQRRKVEMAEFDTVGSIMKRVAARKAERVKQRNLKAAMKQIGASLSGDRH